MDEDKLIELVQELSDSLEWFAKIKRRSIGYDPCGDAEKQKREDMLLASQVIKKSIQEIYRMEG